MAEIDDIQTAFKGKMLERVVHWHERRAGVGAPAGLAADVEQLQALTLRKLDDLNKRTGVSITAAQGVVNTLASDVITANSVSVDLPTVSAW